MKILVRSDNKRIRILCPNFILKTAIGRKCLTASKICEAADKQTAKTITKELYTAIKSYKKKHGSLCLVDIRTSDGDIVKITF